MAFPQTYVGWVTYLRDWLGVDEYSEAQIGAFLDLAHLRLNREMASYGMEAVETITIADDNPVIIAEHIPDFNKVRLVSPRGYGPFHVAAINEMEGYRQGGQVPAPNAKGFYTIDAGLLYMFPHPSVGSLVDIFYYTMVPALGKSPVVNTNIFSLMYPDALLYAACLASTPYTIDPDMAAGWESSYATAITIANEVSDDIKMGSTPLVREIARTGV